jgi:hypothetical protein
MNLRGELALNCLLKGMLRRKNRRNLGRRLDYGIEGGREERIHRQNSEYT